jgi:hypothetical protein
MKRVDESRDDGRSGVGGEDQSVPVRRIRPGIREIVAVRAVEQALPANEPALSY